MTLRDYIEAGLKLKGTGRALAEALGIGSNELSDAKGHRRGLPNHACVKLATLINIEPLTIIAASELATEKKDDKREFWSHLLGMPNNQSSQKSRFTECRTLFIGLKRIVYQELQLHRAAVLA